MQVSEAVKEAAPGEKDTIDTPYGEGVVTKRREDGMMEVKLKFGATAYMKQPEAGKADAEAGKPVVDTEDKKEASEEEEEEKEQAEESQKVKTLYGDGTILNKR